MKKKNIQLLIHFISSFIKNTKKNQISFSLLKKLNEFFVSRTKRNQFFLYKYISTSFYLLYMVKFCNPFFSPRLGKKKK